jgi:hypothetical protein
VIIEGKLRYLRPTVLSGLEQSHLFRIFTVGGKSKVPLMRRRFAAVAADSIAMKGGGALTAGSTLKTLP